MDQLEVKAFRINDKLQKRAAEQKKKYKEALKKRKKQKKMEALERKKIRDSANSNPEMERSLFQLPLTCSKCNKTMTSLGEVHSHFQEHRNCRSSQFKCSLCPKLFVWPFTLIKHFREQHLGPGGEPKVIERKWIFCRFCKKPFLSKKALNIHQNKFHGCLTESIQPKSKNIKPDKRGDRKEISANKDSKNLKPEKRCHKQETSAKKDSIPIAKKGSNSNHSDSSNSNQTTERSFIELPLTCSKCNYQMTSLSKVQSHLSTNPKCRFSQFKCALCPKIFIWPGTLIKHFREQHQGIGGTARVTERKWNFCKVCQKPFLSKQALKIHQDKFHGILIESNHPTTIGKWNFCKFCQKPFLCKQALGIHQYKFHGYLTESNQPTSKKVKPDKRDLKREIRANKDLKNLKPEERCHKQDTSANKDSVPISKNGSNSAQSDEKRKYKKQKLV